MMTVLALPVFPFIVGVALILGGYRAFRYGEEVETKPAAYQKQSALTVVNVRDDGQIDNSKRASWTLKQWA
jgi:hypothetical protein